MYKVLIAEDEEIILQGICKIIDWEELELTIVHKAHDGAEALQMWEEEEVDIVITDITMPDMDGLKLLEELRRRSDRTRFIILSGYDEFEYARRAIQLDVEHYILKPINEELLNEVLLSAIAKLNYLDQKKKETIDHRLKLNYFLEEQMDRDEKERYIKELERSIKKSYIVFANLKFHVNSLKEATLNRITNYILTEYKEDHIQVLYTDNDEFLLLGSWDKDYNSPRDYFTKLQNKIENKYNVLTFMTVGPVLASLQELTKAYKHTKLILQRYLIIEGYGSCIDEGYIETRTNTDIMIDEEKLHSFIVKKDKESAIGYIEDLFINNLKDENVAIDVIYKMSVQLIMILQRIKDEFKINKMNARGNTTEMIEDLYRADDISTIKGIIIVEVIEIIDILQIENSQYSPVVTQILAKVNNDYKEDMSLKTLAYKYNMNASYLGQMFLKEVGCSFSQYLNNTRNKVGRELILKTNMKINDIAKEIGYIDISYFYRKFKKCYGVSPASLREMKKY